MCRAASDWQGLDQHTKHLGFVCIQAQLGVSLLKPKQGLHGIDSDTNFTILEPFDEDRCESFRWFSD